MPRKNETKYDPYGPGVSIMARDHKYAPIKLGWIYSSDMRRPGHINPEYAGPNYRDISEFNRAGKYEITIEDNRVFINMVEIARAPGNFTQTKKTRFLKSVCWALLNDPGALKDKINEYSICETQEAPGPVMEPGPIEEIPGPVPLIKGLTTLGPIRPGWLPWARVLIEEIPIPGAGA